MGREIERLTAAKVRNARSGMHPDGGNLYLQVADGGAKSWIFRYAVNGSARYMGLGPLSDVTLAQARDAARQHRQTLRDGSDPIDARKVDRAKAALSKHAGTTFKEAAERLIASLEGGWRNPKHRAQWRTTLEDTYPVLGSLPVQSIETEHVLKALEPIWAIKPETASRTRSRIEAVLNWATAREMRSGANPARWRGHLDKLLQKPGKLRKAQHHPALPYVQIGEFMPKLRRRSGNASRALEFLILTAARLSEVAQMQQPEVVGRVWTVPAGRMKGDREHRVPLCARAIAILRDAKPSRDGLMFPGLRGRPLTDTGIRKVHRTLGDYRDQQGRRITTHGFRSTFRDWAADRTNYPREVVEACVAHKVGDEAELAYKRSDFFEKRVRLMDQWAAYCGKAEVAGSVVPLRGMKA